MIHQPPPEPRGAVHVLHWEGARYEVYSAGLDPRYELHARVVRAVKYTGTVCWAVSVGVPGARDPLEASLATVQQMLGDTTW